MPAYEQGLAVDSGLLLSADHEQFLAAAKNPSQPSGGNHEVIVSSLLRFGPIEEIAAAFR